MYWDDKANASFRMVRIMALIMLVAMPIFFLGMTYLMTPQGSQGGQNDMLLYMLLIVSVFQPMVSPFIVRLQIDNYKKNQQSQMTTDQFLLSLNIIKFAFVEVIFLYGLLNYVISGELMRMLYFYPIGFIWAFLFWPKRSSYENFVERINSNAPTIG